MKIVLTEQQYKLIIELNIDDLETDKTKDNDYGDHKWFDYHGKYIDYFKDRPNLLKYTFDDTVKYFNTKYNTKKIKIKYNKQTIAYMVYTKTTFTNEEIDIEDNNEYDIILMTAIHPDYRQKGLLKLMIKKANINKPFLITTSELTTPSVWGNFGCSPIKDLNIGDADGNQLQFCK